MRTIYQIAGVTKQAHYQFNKRKQNWELIISELQVQVDEIRRDHPGCGLEKLYWTLKPKTIGRDRFISVFQSLGYSIVKHKNFYRTTIPTHIKFPNLITGMLLDGPNQLWQSDITYFRVNNQYYYLVFIIDAYTKQIKGYAVSDHLRASANVEALKMAFKNSPDDLSDLIHHSDRGSQYVYKPYQELLNERSIYISMGLLGNENAYAERINGTIKNEYLKYWTIHSLQELKRKVKKAVKHYNQKRAHNHLPNRMQPDYFAQMFVYLSNQDKPKVIVYADGKPKISRASSLADFEPRTKPLVHVCPIDIY